MRKLNVHEWVALAVALMVVAVFFGQMLDTATPTPASATQSMSAFEAEN